MIGCIIEIYLFQYTLGLKSMINDLLPTPYSPLQLIYIHRVSHDHEPVDILKHIFNIPVIRLNYLIMTNLSYEWISKYKYTIIFSYNKRPLIHTISLVWIFTQISYRSTDFMFLWPSFPILIHLKCVPSQES